MSLVKLLRAGTLALGIAALACEAAPSPDPVGQGCKMDYDCKDDRYCVNGQCQGNGSIGNDVKNGQTVYTCESGAQMFVDLCCPKVGCGEKTYMDFFSSCKENEAADKMDVENVYACLDNLCASKLIVTRPEIELCYGFVDNGK